MVSSENTFLQGKIPVWLEQQLQAKQEKHHREEIEVKFILPKKLVMEEIGQQTDVTQQELEQIYLSRELVGAFEAELAIPTDLQFKEWRVRRIDSQSYFTAKGPKSADGTKRNEYEIEIDNKLFNDLKKAAAQEGQLLQVNKTRYSFFAFFADESVLVQVDDYHATGAGQHLLDFVSCEVEVPEVGIATILMDGRFFAPQLLFLKQGVNVTGIDNFSNRQLAEYGFIAGTFQQIVAWVNKNHIMALSQAVDKLSRGDVQNEIVNVHKKLDALRKFSLPVQLTDINDIELTQDVLSSMAFNVNDSLGRKDTTDASLVKLDQMGKGWLRDYHEIISSNMYIRLASKPQVFRPGLGYTNTTTRGAHTSDVVATSMQLARQLGLNAELCMAMGAMHDVGHPAGGHVGEEILFELSGRKFKHHVFSLSLVDLFDLNLLQEVQIGAYYHKSGGKELKSPQGLPQEYGVVRVADKISYTPWDLFDSIANGYLTREEVPEGVFDILGQEPMDWIRTLVRAVVQESAEAHFVRFSEKSGNVFQAYKEVRSLLFTRVHSNINWSNLRSQLTMCYSKIEASFPDLDPVPIIAYMTDSELQRLASIVECHPERYLLGMEELETLGFGFCEIIQIMSDPKFDHSNLFYSDIAIQGFSTD